MKHIRIQHPKVFRKGPSWFVQVREEVRSGTDVKRAKRCYWIAPASGPEGVTKTEAQRIAEDGVIRRVNSEAVQPQTLATVQEFWESRFQPAHYLTLRPSGRRHYEWAKTWVMKLLGSLCVRDVKARDVQAAVSAMIAAELSPQSVRHVVNVVSALFRFAIEAEQLNMINPALGVRCPPVRHASKQVLSIEEARTLIGALPSPSKEIASLAMLTSMNIAEIIGLKWRWVNLANEPLWSGKVLLPACSLAVRGQVDWETREYSEVKTPKRLRLLTLAPRMVAMLEGLRAASKFTKPDDFVFAGRTGEPVCQHNLASRQLRPVAEAAIGRPVGWHLFRHSAATYYELVGMPLSDRVAQMGHEGASMTFRYTHSDIERRRQYTENIEERLLPVPRRPPGSAGEQLTLFNEEEFG